MGRQIQILMNREDERRFLDFLRETAPIQLYGSFAPTRDALAVEDFADEPNGHWKQLAHNRRFLGCPSTARSDLEPLTRK